jgi:hypothetical protein
MENKQIKSILFLVGLLAFHIFFWKENLGFNALLFSVLSAFFLAYNFPESRKEKAFWATALGTIALAAMVMVHHSTFAIFAWSVSWFLMIGIGSLAGLHDVFYAFFQGMVNVLTAPSGLSEKFAIRSVAVSREEEEFVPEKATGLRASLFVIPLMIVFAFVILYSIGNETFAKAIGNFLVGILTSFEWLKDIFSLKWILFIGLGLFIIGALIWRNYESSFLKIQQSLRYFIEQPEQKVTTESVNDQYWTAFLTLVMLNVLILIFNIQEFANILNQASDVTATTMRYSVHFGTYVLIFSILVAMGLLFYFFKRELNFIEKSPTLRLLAYTWIGLNGVMVITVAMRNYLYINNYGLAYKRIGVIFFLLLTIFGLITMVLKIKDLRTFRNVVMLNGWSIYIAMILISLINWDVFITKYNLAHTDPERLDLRFLLEDVSDKNLHVLLQYKNQLPNKSYTESHWFGLFKEEYNVEQLLEQKRQHFLTRMDNQGKSVMSWNWIDEVNWKAVK